MIPKSGSREKKNECDHWNERIKTGIGAGRVCKKQVLQVERSRIGLTLAIRGFVYFVQFRIAKVNPFPPIDETSTFPYTQ